MIMNAVLAVALGLAPMKPGVDRQVIQYNPTDYAGLIGRYQPLGASPRFSRLACVLP